MMMLMRMRMMPLTRSSPSANQGIRHQCSRKQIFIYFVRRVSAKVPSSGTMQLLKKTPNCLTASAVGMMIQSLTSLIRDMILLKSILTFF